MIWLVVYVGIQVLATTLAVRYSIFEKDGIALPVLVSLIPLVGLMSLIVASIESDHRRKIFLPDTCLFGNHYFVKTEYSVIRKTGIREVCHCGKVMYTPSKLHEIAQEKYRNSKKWERDQARERRIQAILQYEVDKAEAMKELEE